MAWLAVTAGPPKGKTYQLKVGDNTIGRGSENDLVLDDRSASRNHAMIKVQGDEFVLVDLGSRGGTKVAGQTLKAKEIKPGSVLSLGRTKLNLVEVEAGEESEPGTMSGETIVGQPGGGSGGVLVTQSGPDAGKSFPLSQGDNSIGRDTDSAVLLTDDTVSRRHALIRQDEDRFLVFDLGSRTGIQVDGESISGHKLSAGETVTIGKTEFVLMQTEGQQG